MKKYIILMLLLMFFVTGCGNKKFDLYQGSQDIKITRKSDSGTARINQGFCCQSPLPGR